MVGKKTHDGDIRTPTTHLETEKILFNSAPSRRNTKFMTIDISNFYLMTPMQDYECLRTSINNIPTEIIIEHNLKKIVHCGWVHE